MMKRPPPGVTPAQWARGKEIVNSLSPEILDAFEAEFLAESGGDGDLARITDNITSEARATVEDMKTAGLRHRRAKALPGAVDALNTGVLSLTSFIDAYAKDDADAEFYKAELVSLIVAARYLGAETLDAKHTTLRNAAAGKKRASRATRARAAAAADASQATQAIVNRHAARYAERPGHSKHGTTTIAREIAASVNAALRRKRLPLLEIRSIERRIREGKIVQCAARSVAS